MGTSNRTARANYQQIAFDLAKKIANGHYRLGERLSGRSTLSSQYGVSPETIRRAASILQSMGIVEINKGSGIRVISVENALLFVEQNERENSLHALRLDILSRTRQQQAEARRLLHDITRLMNMADASAHALLPFSIHLKQGMNHIGKTSAEVCFWNQTGATIIAIKRAEKLQLSPGPCAQFLEDDILYCIGEDESFNRVQQFFQSPCA